MRRQCSTSAVEKFERGKTLTVRYIVVGVNTAGTPIRLKGLTEALKFLPR
jgi:hypothetical protein